MDGNHDELAPRRAKKKPGSKPGRGPRSHPGPETGQRQIEAERKSSEAVQLRIAGANLTQIARQLGYADASGAHRAITRALKVMLPEQERSQARRLELAKLDRLEMAAWPHALAGDQAASGTIIRCVGMRAKLLGLEAPTQLDVRVREGEMIRVEILEVLNAETLEALKPFQEEMVRLSELRHNAIEAQATT
jgi:AraC-like DNA-binding protein